VAHRGHHHLMPADPALDPVSPCGRRPRVHGPAGRCGCTDPAAGRHLGPGRSMMASGSAEPFLPWSANTVGGWSPEVSFQVGGACSFSGHGNSGRRRFAAGWVPGRRGRCAAGPGWSVDARQDGRGLPRAGAGCAWRLAGLLV